MVSPNGLLDVMFTPASVKGSPELIYWHISGHWFVYFEYKILFLLDGTRSLQFDVFSEFRL